VTPGDHVLVTGAASGIGRSTAETLLEGGMRVTAIDRSAAVHELEALGATPVVADITDESERLRIAASAGTVDGLVNAAGIIRVAEIDAVTVDDWRAMFAVNVEALFFLTQRLLPAFSRGGSIVNVSSMAAKVGDDASAAYSATKAAVASVTRSLAVRLGPHGIRVNSISPGIILTRMQDDFLSFYAARGGMTEEAFQEARFETVPLRRGGTAQDCASVIRFLLSEESAYITGADVNVSGGLVTW
jgi:NAD(P)-dependent dehydrogenase (short-subunit alcohol dehydrogenase family)